jgi:transposase
MIKPILTTKNIAGRVSFSRMVVEGGYTQNTPQARRLLDHILFTDESLVELWPRPNKQNTRIRTSDPENRLPIQIPKYGLKVMIAGGLSAKGLTELHICEAGATITGKYYREQILPVYFQSIDFADNPFSIGESNIFAASDEVVFMQDGAPAHSARETMDLLTRRFSMIWGKGTWPGNSPDLNPIEHLWAVIQESVFIEPRPKTRQELVSRIRQTWDSTTRAQTEKLVYSFANRILQCHERSGGRTEY